MQKSIFNIEILATKNIFPVKKKTKKFMHDAFQVKILN